MKDYGRVRSTIRPDEIVVDDYSVWVNTDIIEIEVIYEEETYIEYEYSMEQYTKDEYIFALQDKLGYQIKELEDALDILLSGRTEA